MSSAMCGLKLKMRLTVSTSTWQKISGSLKSALIWLILIAIWEGAFRTIGWREYIFPAPSHILRSFLELLNLDARARGTFISSPLVVGIGVSVIRLMMGFTVALGLGAPLGLLLWRSKLIDNAFGPFFLGIQTLPSVCWIPLAVLTFGINQKAVLFVTVMGSAFAIALSLRDGLRTVPPIYHRAGLMLGARGWRFYVYILLPASLPAFVSSLRQGFSFAWRSLMGGELVLIINPHGLGVLLDHGRNFSDVAQVIGVMIVMILLGMVVDRAILARFEHRIHQRFGLHESH